MTELKPCPKCGEKGFVKAATRQMPDCDWEARLKCEECGNGLICFGRTEEDALTAVLKAWNTCALREVGISKLQKITGMSYLEAKRVLVALQQSGAKVVE